MAKIPPSSSRPHPSTALPLTHIAYHVLLALADEARHGYGIIKHVAQLTGGQLEIEAGTLYAAIKRMREEGWIRQRATPPGDDSRRRTYALTDYGRQVLRAECRRLEAMVELARRVDWQAGDGLAETAESEGQA